MFVGVVTAGVLLLGWPAKAGAARQLVITSLVGIAEAEQGNGWASDPDQTASGATALFVDGPASPPAGAGSLAMTVNGPAGTQALVFTRPSGPVPPAIPSPWQGFTASYSTFTTDTTSPTDSVPVLTIVGYQFFNIGNPLQPPSSGLTSLHFEPSNQPAPPAVPNEWQTWTLGPTSLVWQSNQVDDSGFCPQAAPCTLQSFASRYPGGAWGRIQLGLGAFVAPENVTSYVDNVQILDGNNGLFVYDFERFEAPPTTTTNPAISATTTMTVATTTTVAASSLPETLPATGPSGNADLGIAIACLAVGGGLTVIVWSRRGRPTV
jgi:hypothetical protein